MKNFKITLTLMTLLASTLSLASTQELEIPFHPLANSITIKAQRVITSDFCNAVRLVAKVNQTEGDVSLLNLPVPSTLKACYVQERSTVNPQGQVIPGRRLSLPQKRKLVSYSFSQNGSFGADDRELKVNFPEGRRDSIKISFPEGMILEYSYQLVK